MTFGFASSIDENEMLYLIESITARDTTFYAWLSSSKFFDNLEELFMVHLPTQAEWKEYLQVIYHDFLVNDDPN